MQLEALDNRYPLSPHSQQVQLDFIYAYYRNAGLPLAQATIDRFIRLSPTHPDIDYVMCIRGLTNMALDDSVLQGFFSVDRNDHDPQRTRAAFSDFFKLVHGYSNSQYIADATRCLVFLKDRLAKHEHSIAEYCTERGAWAAVANRAESMLRGYPDTQAMCNALPLMEDAYHQIQMNAQIEKVAKIIAASSSDI